MMNSKTNRAHPTAVRATRVAAASLLALAALGSAGGTTLAKANPQSDGGQGSGSVGAIWTTSQSCQDPAAQDQNLYATGDQVHIRGAGFAAGVDITWQVAGQPGGASGDANDVVASGSGAVDSTGAFCVAAYVIAADDWGVYTVDVEQGRTKKNDNYHVEPGTEAPADEPADETPADETPADETPADENTDETPADETPADENTDETPADEQGSTDEDETPADETPADEPADEQGPADETPADETPADEPGSTDEDETPADETPADEDESPADEQTPANDPSADETAADETTDEQSSTTNDQTPTSEASTDEGSSQRGSGIQDSTVETPSVAGTTEPVAIGGSTEPVQSVLSVVGFGPELTLPETDTISGTESGPSSLSAIVIGLAVIAGLAVLIAPSRRRTPDATE